MYYIKDAFNPENIYTVQSIIIYYILCIKYIKTIIIPYFIIIFNTHTHTRTHLPIY